MGHPVCPPPGSVLTAELGVPESFYLPQGVPGAARWHRACRLRAAAPAGRQSVAGVLAGAVLVESAHVANAIYRVVGLACELFVDDRRQAGFKHGLQGLL